MAIPKNLNSEITVITTLKIVEIGQNTIFMMSLGSYLNDNNDYQAC